MYYGGGMSLRVRPSINQLNKLFSNENCIKLTSTKVCFYKKIWEEQFGFIVGWKNYRHSATPPLGSQRNDVWGTSSEIPWERTWERGWNTILMICVVLLINCAARETFFNLSEALFRSGYSLWTGLWWGDGKAKRPVDKHLGPPFHGTRCASDPDATSYWREHWLLTGLIDIGLSVGT